MLQRNFLSATDLNLSDEQRDALIKVLYALEGDQLRHWVCDEDNRAAMVIGLLPIPPMSFNMSWWKATDYDPTNNVCGTTCCIGGWAEQFAGKKDLFRNGRFKHPGHDELSELFYPFHGHVGQQNIDYSEITPQQAAWALSNFLSTGKANWCEVLGVQHASA